MKSTSALEPTSARLLHAIRQTLAQRLAPQLTDGHALALIAAVDVALCELLRRAEKGSDALRHSCGAWSALLEQGHRLLGEHVATHAASPAGPTDTFDDIDALNRQLRTLAVDIIERLMQRSAALDAAGQLRATDLIRAMLEQEFRDGCSETDPPPPEPVNHSDPLAVDHVRLAREIERQLSLISPVSIDSLKYLSGGFSRLTLQVQWSAAGPSQSLVIRKQKPAPLMENVALGVAGEFPVLRFVHSRRIAVPRPLWLQTDSATLGADFIAMERVPGAPLGSAMGAVGVTDDIMRQIAAQLASLHSLRWEDDEQELAHAFRLPAGKIDVHCCLQALLERWEARWRSAQLRPSGLISTAANWLERHKPSRDVRPCLLHGDIGFHNILFDQGKLTALLDWETAFLGDPAKDIATCQSFVGKYTDWDQFLRWYRDAGGQPIDESSVRYYSVLRVYSQLLVGNIALETKFARDPTAEIEYLFLGGPVRRYFLGDYMTCLETITS
jgi:aminoglycoside phosphotransferase (APT) family kinase protein